VWPQLRFSDVAKSLPKDGAEGSFVHVVVENYGESLPYSSRQHSPQFYVATSLGSGMEAKTAKDAKQVMAR
jgi:hypothetical protein